MRKSLITRLLRFQKKMIDKKILANQFKKLHCVLEKNRQIANTKKLGKLLQTVPIIGT